MSKAYKGVFGEIPKNPGNQTPSVIEQAQTQTPNKKDMVDVSEKLTKYNKMSPSERIDFMAEIN
jgi:hypothetical protein